MKSRLLYSVWAAKPSHNLSTWYFDFGLLEPPGENVFPPTAEPSLPILRRHLIALSQGHHWTWVFFVWKIRHGPSLSRFVNLATPNVRDCLFSTLIRSYPYILGYSLIHHLRACPVVWYLFTDIFLLKKKNCWW